MWHGWFGRSLSLYISVTRSLSGPVHMVNVVIYVLYTFLCDTSARGTEWVGRPCIRIFGSGDMRSNDKAKRNILVYFYPNEVAEHFSPKWTSQRTTDNKPFSCYLCVAFSSFVSRFYSVSDLMNIHPSNVRRRQQHLPSDANEYTRSECKRDGEKMRRQKSEKNRRRDTRASTHTRTHSSQMTWEFIARTETAAGRCSISHAMNIVTKNFPFQSGFRRTQKSRKDMRKNGNNGGLWRGKWKRKSKKWEEEEREKSRRVESPGGQLSREQCINVDKIK